MLIAGFYGVLAWVSWVLLAFALFALLDAAVRREDAYRAADKNTKPFWLIILAVAAAVIFILPLMSFLPIIGLVAVIVYMVDVRPAVRAVSGRGGPRILRRRNRGSSSDGPYGPYGGR